LSQSLQQLANVSSSTEGFDFAENLRSRAERTSITGAAVNHLPPPQQIPHQRAKSVATMEPPKAQPVKQRAIPDAMGERILKGDFYMD
jgi:hypothetical protein